ncbi:hypothetical protein [Paenibacillus sp. TY11]|uniref:hypothetical protein n=1 Tax=Paenibacillus sp. TY11 TaxID=3448633 RepID=UPI00403977D8
MNAAFPASEFAPPPHFAHHRALREPVLPGSARRASGSCVLFELMLEVCQR